MEGSANATTGYFAIDLQSGVSAEMTTSEHTALYRFTFKPSSATTGYPVRPLVVQDLSNLFLDQGMDGEIAVDERSRRITGNASYTPSFGEGKYKAYFCTDFFGATFRDHGITSEKEAWVRFDTPHADGRLRVRVGVSFISSEQACRHAETEIPSFDFDRVKSSAEAAWRAKLAPISVHSPGISEELKTTFWSGVYRTMLSPQDYTGENPLWSSDEPYYDSWYCIWDSFRITHPLLTVIDAVAQTRMIRSLIDIYQHEGYLPDCRMSLCQGWMQGGSNADAVIAEAYLKQIKDVNWTAGYEAVVKDAEVQPHNWGDVGRGYIQEYQELGYIPVDAWTFGTGKQGESSVSRTVEYAYNDFCIAEMAQAMGKATDYEKYANRSSNWRHLFRPEQTDVDEDGKLQSTYTGFLQPRKRSGNWDLLAPTWGSPIHGFDLPPSETYEGSSWLYTFYVPGDMAALIKALGGKENFVERLHHFHDAGIIWTGDEQAYLPTFQYHYAGRPGLSAKRAHSYIPREYNSTLVGIPGNDDSGAMGAFSTFVMMGFFPIGGQNVYLIMAPFFKSVSVRNAQTGKTATVRCLNFDPTYKAMYIQSAKMDGRPYTKNWIKHDFFLRGGSLALTLGVTESDWGTRDEDLPPSLSTTGILI